MTRLPGNIMESIRVKAAKAFSKGQFEKNCLMLAEKIEIVPLTNVNETDVNIVGKKFEINTVHDCRVASEGPGGHFAFKIQMEITWTFQTNTKCKNTNHV